MEKKTFNIRFFLKKEKSSESPHAQIVMRITVNGERTNLTTHRGIEPEKWDQKLNKVKGRLKEDRELNDYLKEREMKAFRIKSQLEDKKLPVTAHAIRNGLLGINEGDKGLLEAFAEHNRMIEELEGRDYALATIKRYKIALSVTGEFIQANYKEKDLPLRAVNHKFIMDFEHYLKTKRNCAHNTAMKYLVNLKKIRL